MHRSPRLSIVTVAVALGAVLLPPAVAQAGTYTMYTCRPPGVNIAAPTKGPWRGYGNNPAQQFTENCASPGGHMMVGNNGVPNDYQMARATTEGWELPATALNPAIGVVRINSFVLAKLQIVVLELPRRQYVFPSASLNPGFPVNAQTDGRATGYLSATNDPPAPVARLELFCGDGGAGEPCRLLNNPAIFIAGIVSELAESVAPEGSIDGGALASPGTKAGTATLSYSASDGQSGIERVEVLLDDVVAGAQDLSRNLALPLAQQTGACTYTSLAACPILQSSDIAVDTTKVPNGTHNVTLRIIDAAGNRKDVAGPQIAVANAAAGGAPNGNGASRGAKLTARFAATKKKVRRLRYKSATKVTGRLLDERRGPIGGAGVAVQVRKRSAGARREQLTVVSTAPDGTFSYRLPSGPSRNVTFAYTAFSGDPKPATSKTLRTLVRAKISTSTTARYPRAGRGFRLRGRLRYLPRSGVRLFIQARNGKRWQTIGKVKTLRGGRYSWSYRFSSAARGRSYVFRVQSDSDLYPFAVSYSRKVRVSVRR